MASLPFPDSGTRRVELSNGKPAVNGRAYYYADEDLTVPAEIYRDVNGTKGTLVAPDEDEYVSLKLDAFGRQQDFWGPADGAKRLWILVGGVKSVVDADYKAQIDALGTRVSDLETDSADNNSVLHKAGAETITGVKAFTVSPTVPTPTTSTQAAPKGYVDTTAAAAAAAAQSAAVNTADSNADDKVSVHQADTTNVHGIANTAALVLTGDSRLTDARTPTAHAASHASAGSDPLTVGQAQVTGLTAALTGKVDTTRSITTTAPLTGGGTLSADRTIAVSNATTGAVGVVQLAGDLAGTATAPAIATGAVTSAKIADETIVDGDINASAAIAQSKISGLDTALAAKANLVATKIVIKPEQFGAGGAGVTDDTSAVMQAFAAAKALRRAGLGGNIFKPGATVCMQGVYRLTSLTAAITASCDVDASGATVIAPDSYAAPVFLVGHETSGLELYDAHIAMPDVVKDSTSTLSAGSVGVRVQNLTHSTLKFGRTAFFETGIHFTGLGAGTVYNEIYIGWIDFCKVSLRFVPGAGGWCNQNTFIGGGVTQSPNTFGGAAIRRSGWRHILMDGAGINNVDNNTFINVSLEGDISEYTLDLHDADRNVWLSPRFEQGTAGVPVTVSGATITLAAHGFAVGDMVAFLATVSIPGGMTTSKPYFVRTTPTSDTFTVDAGAPNNTSVITFTTTGSGVLLYRPVRMRFDGANTHHNSIRNALTWPGPISTVITNGAYGNTVTNDYAQALEIASKQPRLTQTVDTGAGGDYASLIAALTAVGSTPTDVAVTSEVTLTAHTTIPAGVSLWVGRTGSIALNGFTLTINGRLHADRTTIFSGSGSVVLGAGSVDAAYPEWWGAKAEAISVATPAVDSGPAITKAIYAVKGHAGVVSLGGGKYRVSTTIDASNIQPASYEYNSAKAVTIQGLGRYITYLSGGEAAYGFLEMVGSNYMVVGDFTILTSQTCQFGILSGRTTGDFSSGNHTFRNVYVYGAFSGAAHFALSSEINTYELCGFYTTLGRPVVSAKDIAGHTPSAKYTPLSTTVPLGGGNGVNRMVSCDILSISPNPADTLLTLEFLQSFTADNLYMYSENAQIQILFSKLCHAATFTSLHQEHGAVEPFGVYFSAIGSTPYDPQFRNVKFDGARAYTVYAETGTELANVTFDGIFRGTASYQFDVDVLWSGRVECDGHLEYVSEIAAPSYRVRTGGDHWDWGNAPDAQITVPDASLNRVTTVGRLSLPAGPRAMLGGSRYYTSAAGGTTTLAQTAGWAYAMPIWIPKATAFDRIAVHVTSGAASSTMNLGIYSVDALDMPITLVQDYGTVDTSTTGLKYKTISRVLNRGWHYLACLTLGGTPVVYVTTGAHPLMSNDIGIAAEDLNGFLLTGQSALPTTWGTRSGVSYTPKLALRV